MQRIYRKINGSKTAAIMILLSTLLGCGGGSSGGTTPPTVISTSSSIASSSSSVASSSSSSTPAIVTEDTLPRIDIYNLAGTIQNEPKITAQMKVTEYVIGELPLIDYDGFIGVEYRGSSSQFYYAKKNFGVETRDSEGADLDASILGFPEEEDWVLHGPFGDKSLLRNTLMFDVAQAFGRYTSRWKYAEVYINNQYQGLYVLLEKIKRNKNRVDISKLKDTDIEGEELTGGYIVKLDKTDGEHPDNPSAYNLYTDDMSFISNYGAGVGSSEHHFIYNYPKPKNITSEQKIYIQSYVHAFEDALAGNDFKDETLGYRNFIDIDSFVDYFIATEISGNVDGFRLSTYLSKDKNKKLAMGPLWDYNLAFGNANYCGGNEYGHWIHKSEDICEGGVFGVPFWWNRLMEDPYFTNLVKIRWTALRNNSLSDNSISGLISEKSNYLKTTGAADRNFNRWNILGIYVWPNNYIGMTYDDEVAYVDSWLMGRLAWLDTEIENL